MRTACGFALATLLATAALGVLPTASHAAAITFINEIHYDNSGADVGEAIEIAGPAGTDLSGWSLVLYNGSTQLSYSTLALSGVIANQSAGFGTRSFAAPGLQNGSPDGIALVNGGSVVQFLSYEGSFTAANGPALGMGSVNIGVAEGPSTAAGLSMQLRGAGSTYEDFFWTAGSAASFGAINAGQLFGATPWINEFHYDNTGTDAGEGIEIAGAAGVDLTGWSLVLYNGSTGAPYDTLALGGVLADQLNGYGTLAFGALGLQNGAPDGIALIGPGGEVAQFLSYEGIFTASGGPADGLLSQNVGVFEPSSTPLGLSLQLVGLGTGPADFTWTGPIGHTFGSPNTGQRFPADVVPEPSTFVLFGLGMVAFVGRAARRRALARDVGHGRRNR